MRVVSFVPIVRDTLIQPGTVFGEQVKTAVGKSFFPFLGDFTEDVSTF